MENITAFISNIASEVIALLFGLMLSWLIKIIKKAKANNNQSANATKYDKIFLALRYLAILTIIVLFFSFIEFTKWFVVFISLIFSILSVMLIYDYFLHTLKSIISDQEKEEYEEEYNHLLDELEQSDTTEEHKKYIIKRLKELRKSF